MKAILNINMAFSLKEIAEDLKSYRNKYLIHVIKLTSLREYPNFQGNENHWMNEIRNFVSILKNKKLKTTNKVPDKITTKKLLQDNLFSYPFNDDTEEDIIGDIISETKNYNEKFERYLCDNIKSIRENYLKFNEFLIKKVLEYKDAYDKLSSEDKNNREKIDNLFYEFICWNSFRDFVINM